MKQTAKTIASISVFACGCVILGLAFWANAAAAKDPPGPEETDSQQAKIMQALQGDGPAQTGDGVLDDILEIAKQRGSVLDGSLLDDDRSDDRLPGVELGDPSHKMTSPQKSATSQPARTARVAEQLLKAARLLESVSNDDSNDPLIDAMRRKAGDLLIDTKEETR